MTHLLWPRDAPTRGRDPRSQRFSRFSRWRRCSRRTGTATCRCPPFWPWWCAPRKGFGVVSRWGLSVGMSLSPNLWGSLGTSGDPVGTAGRSVGTSWRAVGMAGNLLAVLCVRAWARCARSPRGAVRANPPRRRRWMCGLASLEICPSSCRRCGAPAYSNAHTTIASQPGSTRCQSRRSPPSVRRSWQCASPACPPSKPSAGRQNAPTRAPKPSTLNPTRPGFELEPTRLVPEPT